MNRNLDSNTGTCSWASACTTDCLWVKLGKYVNNILLKVLQLGKALENNMNEKHKCNKKKQLVSISR